MRERYRKKTKKMQTNGLLRFTANWKKLRTLPLETKADFLQIERIRRRQKKRLA